MWIEANRQCHQQARLLTFPDSADVCVSGTDRHLGTMCGRVIQSGGPLRYGIVEGLDVRDNRVHNYPPRWNAAPSQELLVIRRNHQTGEVSLDPLRWGLIPYWCEDPKGGRKPINAKCETVDRLPMFRDAYRRRRCILPVDGFYEWKAIKGRRRSSPMRSPSGTASRSASVGCGRTGRIRIRVGGFARQQARRRGLHSNVCNSRNTLVEPLCLQEAHGGAATWTR
jgi:SOS response associated peptidase (SRAP)